MTINKDLSHTQVRLTLKPIDDLKFNHPRSLAKTNEQWSLFTMQVIEIAEASQSDDKDKQDDYVK